MINDVSYHIFFGGGGSVEFGDIAIASATFFVISVFLYMLLPNTIIFNYIDMGFIISVLVAGLIVSIMYAHKLVDQRVKSIAKILVLSAVLIALFTVGMVLTDAREQIVLSWFVGGPFAFIGLYVGSMLRKPKRS